MDTRILPASEANGLPRGPLHGPKGYRPLVYPEGRRVTSHESPVTSCKPFRFILLSKNAPANHLESHSCKNKGLKVSCFHTLTKNIGGRGCLYYSLASLHSPATSGPWPLLESAFLCLPTRLSPSAISQNTSAPSSAAKVFAAASSTSSIAITRPFRPWTASALRSPAAKWSATSAPTAPANPLPSRCSPAFSCPPPARSARTASCPGASARLTSRPSASFSA